MTHTPMNDEIRKLALSLESDGVIAAYRAYFGPGYPPAQDKIDNLREAIATYLTVAKPAPVSRELEEAREVIRPFAELAASVFRMDDGREMNETKPDDSTVWGFDNANISYGDLRRARDFIKEGGNND